MELLALQLVSGSMQVDAALREGHRPSYDAFGIIGTMFRELEQKM
jgi:hypothetical protein